MPVTRPSTRYIISVFLSFSPFKFQVQLRKLGERASPLKKRKKKKMKNCFCRHGCYRLLEMYTIVLLISGLRGTQRTSFAPWEFCSAISFWQHSTTNFVLEICIWTAFKKYLSPCCQNHRLFFGLLSTFKKWSKFDCCMYIKTLSEINKLLKFCCHTFSIASWDVKIHFLFKWEAWGLEPDVLICLYDI